MLAPVSGSISESPNPPDPYLYSGVHVSLIGHDIERVKELGQEVCEKLEGNVISEGALGNEEEKPKAKV